MQEEKRSYPRIKSSLKANVCKDRSVNLIDLSETGLSFNFTEAISSPMFPLKFSCPDTKFELKIDAKLVWKRDFEKDSFSYGVEFMGIDESQKAMLREYLIESLIANLLIGVDDPGIKDNISTFFLKDLSDYISELIQIVHYLSKDNRYSEKIENKLTHLNNLILLKGYNLEKMIENRVIVGKIKENFRLLVGTWAYKSPIVKRAFEKPRGYPGDYLMLETVYNKQTFGKGIGFYFDKYFLCNPYAVAVRYRKDKLCEIIKKTIQQSTQKTIKIINIACGSCREIKELPREIFHGKQVRFTCIDWDQEALDFSREALKEFSSIAEFNFIKEDIMTIMKDIGLSRTFEKQDLVYSIGLIDYLPDRILKVFMSFFYKLLSEKGILILTHKNKDKTFSPLSPDWFCEWKFVPRSKEEVVNLFYNCGLEDFSLSIEVDQFNDIFYFTITKH